LVSQRTIIGTEFLLLPLFAEIFNVSGLPANLSLVDLGVVIVLATAFFSKTLAYLYELLPL